MAKETKKKTITAAEFLASDRKLNQLSRQELAELDEELDKDHWLKKEVTEALRSHIVG